jgi:hypothetical protein
MLDILIRNGWGADGTGNPTHPADVAIEGDRIVAVGSRPGRVRALDGRLGRMNITRAIETLGTLAAASLAVEHTEMAWSSLMAGLDAIIAQALASGTDHSASLSTTVPAHLRPFPPRSASSG